MFTKTFLYPYKQNSQSCKNLATTLQAKIIKLTNNLYKHKPTHQVINWGNSTPPEFTSLNKHTQDASNKLLSFQRFRDANLSIPPWTTDIEEAKTWLPETVFARTLLTGHSGVGIVEFTGTEQAPLYVKYIKKRHEYRIHVVKDHIIDIQQKKRKTGTNSNSKIRNLQNGWIYARENINQPKPEAFNLAKQAIKALNLDFGAVDIIYNEHQDKYYLLEVNTAPGLTGTTITNYANALKTL